MIQTKSPHERQTSVEFVLQSLYVDILEGVHKPGTFLRLNDVAKQLGISIMPVREAIRELASLGIVESIPHRGAQVRLLTIEDLIETYRGRLFLESVAMRLGAQNFDAEQAHLAREANDRRIAAVEHGETLNAVLAHEAFHFQLYAASKNPWIVRSLLPGWRNAERYRGFSMRNPDVQEQLDLEHALMVDAMEKNDVLGSIELLYSHLTSAAEAVALELENESIIDRLPSLKELTTCS